MTHVGVAGLRTCEALDGKVHLIALMGARNEEVQRENNIVVDKGLHDGAIEGSCSDDFSHQLVDGIDNLIVNGLETLHKPLACRKEDVGPINLFSRKKSCTREIRQEGVSHIAERCSIIHSLELLVNIHGIRIAIFVVLFILSAATSAKVGFGSLKFFSSTLRGFRKDKKR